MKNKILKLFVLILLIMLGVGSILGSGGGGGSDSGVPPFTQNSLEGIWNTGNRYFIIDKTGELKDVVPLSTELIHDFYGSFIVDNKNATGTVYLDHTPTGGGRNAHDINYSGLFKNIDQIDMDWEVPGYDTGVEYWRRIPYIGAYGEANITLDNAFDFAVDTWITIDLGKIVLQQIEEILQVLDFEIPSSDTSGSVEGPCGGIAIFDGSVDEAGEMTASINIENYCVEGIIIDGSANLTATVDPDTKEIYRFGLSFKSATFTVPEEGYLTIDGTFRVDWTIMKAWMSYVLKTSDSKTYWLNVQLEFDLAEGEPYTEFTNIIGRYYDNYYGYVNISVGDIIRLYDEEYWPSIGSLILIGSQDAKTRLTFLNSTEFIVDADIDDDGEYDDYSSGIQLWP